MLFCAADSSEISKVLIKLQVPRSKHLPDANFISYILVYEIFTASGYTSVFGRSDHAENKIN